MSERDTPPARSEETESSNTTTVVAIPQAHTQAVLDFLAGLEQDGEDVSGHMINRGMVGGFGQLSAVAKEPTHTGCERYDSKVGYDFDCSDTDTQTTTF
jgi:hypothetical protein